MDGQGQIDFLFSAVPADSMGNMVFRYDPVSNPILYRGELLYLRMPYYLHKIKNKTYKHDSTSYINIGKYIFDDIITLNGVNLFFHGHKNLPQKVIEEVVSNINLETGKSEMIFTFVGPTTVSNVTSDGKNIFVAHKYTSKIDVYSLNNGKYDSIYLEPSKLRKYKSIEYKKEYLSLPLKEKVAYREDRFLDYKVIQGFHFQLIGYFDRDGNQDDGFYKHLITVNKDGEIKEKALPPNFLNFDNFGNVYSLKKEDGKTYLITTPVLDLMDW
jgi:hypothetical protein